MPNPLQKTQDQTSHYCKKCVKLLVPDAIYYCTSCLAEAFDVKKENIEAKIQYFKEIGCTLFN